MPGMFSSLVFRFKVAMAANSKIAAIRLRKIFTIEVTIKGFQIRLRLYLQKSEIFTPIADHMVVEISLRGCFSEFGLGGLSFNPNLPLRGKRSAK